MTLIAGLVCDDGIVFAADSEESGVIRKSVEKILHNRTSVSALGGFNPKRSTVVVAAAGNAALADYATQEILIYAPYLTTVDEIEQKIVEILTRIFTVNVPLHPVTDPLDAAFELLIGIRLPNWSSSLLYSTHGVTLVRRPTYFVCGSGALTEYILDQLYKNYMPLEDGITASLYMLQLAKKYISGVGGTSQITILKNDGEVDAKPNWEISEEEKLSREFGTMTGILLLSAMRTRTPLEGDDFRSTLKVFNKNIREFRRLKQKSDFFMDEFNRRTLERLEENEAKEIAKEEGNDSIE